jgi:hypothetical protein
MSPTRSLFNMFSSKVMSCAVVFLLVLAVFAVSARAQITFGSPVQLVDNDANQGSPFIITFNSQLYMYYVNHTNNTIYVDRGLTGSPSSTGIVVYSPLLTDVGAAVLNGKVLISYVAPDQNLEFALSSNGINFGPPVNPLNSSLGLGNEAPNVGFVPALVSNGSTVYIATVAADNLVYMSTTTDGNTFTPLNGGSVSSITTISRPYLTIYEGNPWIGYVDSSRHAVVGNATLNNAPEVGGNIGWENSHRGADYASIALLSYNGLLYVFGQDTASSQQLKYMYSNGGSSWSPASFVGNQMRWTPSLTILGSVVYLVYQDDANTNISYRIS